MSDLAIYHSSSTKFGGAKRGSKDRGFSSRETVR